MTIYYLCRAIIKTAEQLYKLCNIIMAITLKDLKKGTYFRFVNQTKVRIYRGKERHYSRTTLEYKGWGYGYSDFDDISSSYTTLKNREVDTEFEF